MFYELLHNFNSHSQSDKIFNLNSIETVFNKNKNSKLM